MADAQDLGSCTERCRGSTPLSCILAAIVVIVVACLLAPAIAEADTLWVSSGGAGAAGAGGGGGSGGAIQVSNAKITRIERDQIFFVGSTGAETSRKLEQVQRLNVDNEPALNAAEESFAAGKFDQAVDQYQTVVRATNKPWIKEWSAARLAEAGSKSGRFDAMAAAYVAAVLKDPAAAGAQKRPPVPAERSPQVDAAAGEASAATNASGLNDEQRAALLTFLVDIQRARKDAAAEAQASAKLDEVLARDPRSPAAAQAGARRTLQAAQRALESKDYAKAIGEIDANRAAFADPAQQADALWLIAEARLGLAQSAAGGSAGAGSAGAGSAGAGSATAVNAAAATPPTGTAAANNANANANALRDAALAYMRIVAHFGDLPNKPHVAESLMKTAQIEEQLGERDAALRLYQQVAAQFPDDPLAAPAAKQNAQRLATK